MFEVRNKLCFIVALFCTLSISTCLRAEYITLTNLTIEKISIDTTGQNKIVYVSPTQTQCYSLALSAMLFNDVGENASMAYSALLAALAAGKKVEIIHDGTSYCKILRVTVLK